MFASESGRFCECGGDTLPISDEQKQVSSHACQVKGGYIKRFDGFTICTPGK